MVFHWSLSDSNSPQVSRTRLRILAVLSNAVIWIVSTRPLTSKSSGPFNNPLDIVAKVPITIGIIVTLIFLCFFDSLARLRYLSLFSHSYSFTLWSARIATSTILQVLFLRITSTTTTIIIIWSFRFFTSTLADGLSLEFEWQQVSSSIQDSSQYSGRSQQCYSLDGPHSSSNFHVLQSLYQMHQSRLV